LEATKKSVLKLACKQACKKIFKNQSVLLKFKAKKEIVVDFFCSLFTNEGELQVS